MSLPARLALLLGAIAGLALGLYIGWVAAPVKYVNTAPASLRADFKADYAVMTAEVFADDGNVQAARTRLTSLGVPSDVLPAAFDAALALHYSADDLRRLAALADVLNAATPAMADYLP